MVERASETQMRVSWTGLSPVEARGHLTHYTIHYWPASDTQLVMRETVAGNRTSVEIGGLRPGESYVVTVSATTGAGSGPNSTETSLASLGSGRLTHHCH